MISKFDITIEPIDPLVEIPHHDLDKMALHRAVSALCVAVKLEWWRIDQVAGDPTLYDYRFRTLPDPVLGVRMWKQKIRAEGGKWLMDFNGTTDFWDEDAEVAFHREPRRLARVLHEKFGIKSILVKFT